MGEIITLPRRFATETVSVEIGVLNEDFIQELWHANMLLRKLREWGIRVKQISQIGVKDAIPMLHIEYDPAKSIKPLLDSTENRMWIPATDRLPCRMVAYMDRCVVVWELPERRARPRIKRVCAS